MKQFRIGTDLAFRINASQYIKSNSWVPERRVYAETNESFNGQDSNDFVNWWEVSDDWALSEGVNPNDPHMSTYPTTFLVKHNVGIRSIKVYLINKTIAEQRKKIIEDKARFVSRFPIEPYTNPFDSTRYDICCSGTPCWHTYPTPKRIVPYAGFGVYPDWGRIYQNIPTTDDTKYIAPVYATNKQHIVEVRFPAEDLKLTGVYDAVIVMKLYAPGFNEHNLKTVTVDVPNLFELTDNSERSDETIKVDVFNIQDALDVEDEESPAIIVLNNDIYATSGAYVDNSDGSDYLQINRTDGNSFDINMDEVSGWGHY